MKFGKGRKRTFFREDRNSYFTMGERHLFCSPFYFWWPEGATDKPLIDEF